MTCGNAGRNVKSATLAALRCPLVTRPCRAGDMTRAGEEWLARVLDAIAQILLRNIGLQRFRGRDVDLAGGVLVLQFGQTATIQREGELRIDPQRRVVCGNGGIELSHFQKNEAATVERGSI